jgi:hypothetical protein
MCQVAAAVGQHTVTVVSKTDKIACLSDQLDEIVALEID